MSMQISKFEATASWGRHNFRAENECRKLINILVYCSGGYKLGFIEKHVYISSQNGLYFLIYIYML